MSDEQNVGQNHNIKIANRYFENVAGFKYLRTTLTNEDLMHEEVKSRLHYGMPATIRPQFFSFPFVI